MGQSIVDSSRRFDPLNMQGWRKWFHHALRNSAMDICKIDTDSETILAECEMIQKQWATTA